VICLSCGDLAVFGVKWQASQWLFVPWPFVRESAQSHRERFAAYRLQTEAVSCAVGIGSNRHAAGFSTRLRSVTTTKSRQTGRRHVNNTGRFISKQYRYSLTDTGVTDSLQARRSSDAELLASLKHRTQCDTRRDTLLPLVMSARWFTAFFYSQRTAAVKKKFTMCRV